MMVYSCFIVLQTMYGYEVGPDGQFHHEVRGPDGVVYGCYGYIDPNGKLQATHYVSDAWGYRTVKPGEPVELFLHPHGEGDGGDHHGGDHHGGDHHGGDHHGGDHHGGDGEHHGEHHG
ncbi:Cuticular protein, partial [Gryllus bimaculatus]